ncbi:MAG: hypothetical protein M3128_00190 [Verrucomicrobiota bacterium]|nr:hypothetical protein [Verrucomicrobiota bacterium]
MRQRSPHHLRVPIGGFTTPAIAFPLALGSALAVMVAAYLLTTAFVSRFGIEI